MKILLVDDEREEREGISFLIQKFGYPLEVLQAANGKEALYILENEHIDILFTDVKMPVMSGLELSKIVRSTNKDMKIIIFSAYAEFEYAKQALEMNVLHYLLKPIEIAEFKKIMDDVLSSIEETQRTNEKNRRDLLFKIFTGTRLDKESEQVVKRTLFSHCEEGYRFLNLEFVNNYFEENEEFFLSIVKKYLGEKVEYIALYPNESYLLLMDIKLTKNKKLTAQIEKMTVEMQRYAKEEWLLFVSPLFFEIDELEHFLKEVERLKMDIFGYGNRIIEMDQHYERTEHYVFHIESVRNELIMSLDSKNPEFIQKLNTQLVQTILAAPKVSKLYVQNILYTVIKAMYQELPGIETEEVLVTAEALFLARDANTILAEYEKIVEKIMASFCWDANETDTILHIKGLIEREYSKDISLDYVAEQVHLAPAYVSYIFKQETGQSLVKYVTDVKMAKARKFLEDKDMKIVQVGKACGYENQSYFNRLFKNYHGVTPKQYREQLSF